MLCQVQQHQQCSDWWHPVPFPQVFALGHSKETFLVVTFKDFACFLVEGTEESGSYLSKHTFSFSILLMLFLHWSYSWHAPVEDQHLDLNSDWQLNPVHWEIPASPCSTDSSTFQAVLPWNGNSTKTIPAGLWFWSLLFCYRTVPETFNSVQCRLCEQNCLLSLYALLKSNLKRETSDCPWCFFRQA